MSAIIMWSIDPVKQQYVKPNYKLFHKFQQELVTIYTRDLKE